MIYLKDDSFLLGLCHFTENIVHDLQILVPRQSRSLILIEVVDKIVEQEVGSCKGSKPLKLTLNPQESA